MPMNETIFCQLLGQNRLNFEEISLQFASVKRERQDGWAISTFAQSMIHANLPRLLPGFAGEATLKTWRTPISPLTLNNWLMGMSVLEPGENREALLKDTAILLRQMPSMVIQNELVSDTAFVFEHIQDADLARETLRTITEQLRCREAEVTLPMLSQVLYSLHKVNDPTEASVILSTLLPHLVKARQRREHFSPHQIALVLYGLQSQPDAPVAFILNELVYHILTCKAQNKPMSNAALRMAFGSLHNIQASAQAKGVLPALHAHLREQVMEMKTFCSVLHGLHNMEHCAEVRAVLATLVAQLQYMHPGYVLDPEGFSRALDSLNALALLPEAMVLYQRLMPQITATAVALDTKVLGKVLSRLESLPDSSEKQELIRVCITSLRKHIERSSQPLDSGIIASLLDNLHKQPFLEETSPVLAGLKALFERNAQAGQWMGGIQIYEALYSLQDMPVSGEIEGVVAALTPHMRLESFSGMPPVSKKRLLAEAAYYLRQHFSSSGEAGTAKDFLRAAAQALGLRFDAGLLHTRTLMEQILVQGEYLAQTGNGEIRLDIRRCTTKLAQALCEYVLAQRQRGGFSSLTILFTSGGEHSPETIGTHNRKHAFLQRMLAGENGRWKQGEVTVTTTAERRGAKREASVLVPAGQPAAAARQEPQSKRARTEHISPQVVQRMTSDRATANEETEAFNILAGLRRAGY